MTTQHPEALRLAWLLELAPEDGVEPQTTEDAAAELRRQHARIAELEARIKTMTKEHTNKLIIAHLDGRMRTEQAIPGVQWQYGPQTNGFTAPQADSQPAVDEATAMDRTRELAESGRWPSDWVEAYRRGYSDRAARAPSDSVLEDAARLDFLIEQRAYVVSDPDTCPGYWLHFVHKETGKCWVQCDEHPTPRAAIDAAMNKGGA